MIKITTESVRAKLSNENEIDRTYVRVHQVIGDVLVKFAGKKLTRRVSTALAEKTGWNVQWDCGMVMTEVRVWGGDSGLTVHDDVRFALCYPSENNGDYATTLFERHDACHGSAALARIEQRQAILAAPHLIEAYVSSVNETLAKLEAITGFLGLDAMPSSLRYDAKHLIEKAVENI